MVAAQCDGNDVGESLCGYEWVSRIAERCDVTLLTARLPRQIPASVQLPSVRVIEWEATGWLPGSRVNGTLKPWYFLFALRARRWIARALQEGQSWDVMHHLTPMALRFPSPCPGLGIPYVIGPVAGGLPTPPGFKGDIATEPLATRLRETDGWRIQHDPLLRRSYQNAEVVICSGNYVAELLAPLELKRVVFETEFGIDDIEPTATMRPREPATLRLLYVGRVVRTKGLRDAIRALAKLGDLPNVKLTVAGDGEDLDACRSEAHALGLDERIHFLGRVRHENVGALYEEADVFLFPSFREPLGIVLFEAMSHGLPVITTTVGGPGHIVDDTSGYRIEPDTPENFANEIAARIRILANDRRKLSELQDGSRNRIRQIGLWSSKIDRVLTIYQSVLAGHRDASLVAVSEI